jgi:hypothetical protein
MLYDVEFVQQSDVAAPEVGDEQIRVVGLKRVRVATLRLQGPLTVACRVLRPKLGASHQEPHPVVRDNFELSAERQL